MTTNRRIVCEAAFGFGPFDTLVATNWVELIEAGRPRIKEASWSFGRDDELEHFQPGTATILLSNRDRHLDPDNPSSPHAGNLLPYTPVRLRSKNEDTGTFEDEFYGFVVSGWEQVLAPKRIGDCRIELVDYLGVVSGYKLTDVFEYTLQSFNPVNMWVLDSGESDVPDHGSRPYDGVVLGDGVTLGDRVIAPGHNPAARFEVELTADGDSFGNIDLGRSPIVPLTELTDVLLVATFRASKRATDDRKILFAQSNGQATSLHALEAHIHTDGRMVFGSIATLTAASANSVVDNRGHILFANNENLGIDTATLSGLGSVSKPSTDLNGAAIGGGQGIRSARHFDGWIGVVALLSHAATGLSGRTAILDAYSKLSGQRSDQQIAWALDRVGIPAGKRNLSIGTVLMGPAVTKDKDALAFIREVAATEGGNIYVDHRDGGKIRFTDRYHRFLATRSTTSQATFSDDPNTSATVAIRYPAEGLDVASNGLDGIINQVDASWVDGTVTVQDDTSIASYGPRQRTLETVATTPGQARSTAEWIIARYSQPRSRIRGCTASARHTQQRHDKVQGAKIDDRITFRVQPLHTGTATTVTLYIDGISHTASGVMWETSFRFAQAETFTPWIWGTSAWGTTKFWG